MSGRGPRGRARSRTDTAQAPIPAPTSEAESGRGRGIVPATTEQAPAAAGGGSPTGSGSGSGSGGSPTSGAGTASDKSRESPPQPAVGRAATRGKPAIQPQGPLETGLLDPLSRLSLQGEHQEQRRQREIELVPLTKPLTCTDKKGKDGIPVSLMANYFEAVSKPDWLLYQYHVDFNPAVDSKRMRQALLHNHNNLFPDNKAFDGSTLYSLTKLPNEITDVVSVRTTDNTPINIRIKRVCEVVPTSPQFVQLFNIVFRRCLGLYGMTPIQQNYYDMSSPIQVKQYNLEIVNGFTTAISIHERKLLLCAEVSHRVISTATVFDKMNDFYNKNPQNVKAACQEALVGQIIMTKYNNKTYKIDDIDWDSSPLSTFDRRDGNAISFVEYYKTHYDINIREVNQPLLISRPKEKDKRREGEVRNILLIPELCVVTGISDTMREDTFMMRELATQTRLNPDAKISKISRFIGSFNENEKVKAEFNKWQMKFDSRPIKVEGRVLPKEVLLFGNSTHKQLMKADWNNDMKSARHLSAVPLQRWLLFYAQRDENQAYEFSVNLNKVAKSMGMMIDEPEAIAVQEDRTEYFISSVKQKVKSDTQMAVFILSSNRKDRYDAIKKQCCLDLAVPSQCLLVKNIKDAKKAMAVITKIAIQMNCKLGGEIWGVSIPIKRVMICGIDTYHDSAKKDSSVCAFIATMNETKTRFFSRATLQATHQELSNNLTLVVKSALQHFSKVNGGFPEKIIIYRDGVDDGKLLNVRDYEIPQIQKAFELTQADYSPRLTFIVVKKRGNARFFQQTNQGITNPEYGTIVDNTVTRAEWYDFYLISQSTTQGTVNPTHYNVIHDTSGLLPDHLQKLSHKLTHMYYNWPGTIRVPALCQYAHKLAFLTGQSLHKEHNLSLSDKLFYL